MLRTNSSLLECHSGLGGELLAGLGPWHLEEKREDENVVI